MLNSRIALTLVGVFLAGVGTGMVGMRYGLHDQLHQPTTATAPTPADQTALLARYREELNLSPEQTAKLAVVLEDWQHYYESVQEQINELRLQEQIDDLRATGKSRILEILNPEQRQRFEKMTGLDPATPAASQ